MPKEWVNRQGNYSCESLKVVCTDGDTFVKSFLLDERESTDADAEDLTFMLNELELYRELGSVEELQTLRGKTDA